MLKHSDIIEKLDSLQKVALVASALEDEALEQAGVPPVGRAELGALAAKEGCSYRSAACSWNAALIEEMTRELAAEAGADGARLFVTPDLKAAAGPYAEGLTEDAELSGMYGAAMARGVHAAGGAVGLGRLSLGAAELACLDRREDLRAVHELAVKPFLLAAKKGCDAVFLTPSRAGEGYPDTNRALFSDVLAGRFGNAFAVGEGTAPTSEAVFLLQGRATLGGAALPLERAARRYEQLVAFRGEGSVSERDVEDALREGSALSRERLDEAADEVADFAIRLSELTLEPPAGDAARRAVAEESIVLLKNNAVLPLAQGTKIAVVGEAYPDLSPLAARFEVAGTARGYDRATDRSDALIPEAMRAANGADVVLAFLRPDPNGRSLALPANRLALLGALEKAGKRVVTVLLGDLAADMRFDRDAAASLYAPEGGKYAAEALARVLAGEVSPSGKLARTLYDGADERVRALREERDSGLTRVGGFTGYLRYDTAGETVRYPFGYGLSYTKFVYSSLSVEGDTVSFTVRNAGKHDGAEVAEVYIGEPCKSHVAPSKRFKAAAKVFLRAGESKRVSLTLPPERYATFDRRTFAENVEGGTYRIFVGASSQDIRLRGKRTLAGVEREREKETAADYFPGGDRGDVAEVGRESRLAKEDGRERVPRRLRIARRTALCLLPAVLLLFFLIVTMLIFSYALDYVLLFTVDEQAAAWALYILASAVVAFVPLFGSLSRRRMVRIKKVCMTACPILLLADLFLGHFLGTDGTGAVEAVFTAVTCLAVGTVLALLLGFVLERELVRTESGANRWARFYFEPEKQETTTPDTQFEEAFRAADEARAKTKGKQEEPRAPIAEVPQFYDRHLTFEVLFRDCKRFAAERGVLFEDGDLRDLLAAFTASRLIIVPSGGAVKGCSAVAEYLGGKPYVDNAEQYMRCDDLFSEWRSGERLYLPTALSEAFAEAGRKSAVLHTAIIRHADVNRLAEVFGPVAEVLSRRRTAIPSQEGDRLLPPNLQLVVELDSDGTDIPEKIAEVAAVLSPQCKEGVPAQRKTVVHAVGFERFSALRNAVRDEFPVGEALWKDVDRLDAQCRAAHIGNLAWVRLELHASAVIACGGKEREALDGALAAELVPWLNATWDDETGGLFEALREIFGRDFARSAQAAKRAATKEKGARG